MVQKERIVTKAFFLLFLFSVLICTGMNMLNVIVPLYVTEDLGLDTGVAGLMTTVYTIAACASRPINGVLTEKVGRRALMALGALLFGVGCVVGGLIPSIVVLAICRVSMGIGYSAASTANNTASTDVIPASRLTEGIGYFGMSQSVASAFGPALAAVLIAAIGNRGALMFDGAVAAVAIVVALLFRHKSTSEHQPTAPQRAERARFWERSALVPSLYQGLSLFLISCPMCFMSLYIVSRGLSSGVAGSFFVVSSVMIIAVRLICSDLLARFGATVFLVLGYLVLIVTCLLLPLADQVPLFMVCGALFGLSHGMIWMTLGSEAVRFAPAAQRGAANATFYFAFDAAIGIGAAFWGALIYRVGYPPCFYAIAVCTVILMLTAIPVFRRRRAQYAPST